LLKKELIFIKYKSYFIKKYNYTIIVIKNKLFQQKSANIVKEGKRQTMIKRICFAVFIAAIITAFTVPIPSLTHRAIRAYIRDAFLSF